MSAEIVPINGAISRRWKGRVPKEHSDSLDTRLKWLWNQRFGTVQTVYLDSDDLLDRTAATLILQAIIGNDLRSIQQLFNRLEGGAVGDSLMLDNDTLRI